MVIKRYSVLLCLIHHLSIVTRARSWKFPKNNSFGVKNRMLIGHRKLLTGYVVPTKSTSLYGTVDLVKVLFNFKKNFKTILF